MNIIHINASYKPAYVYGGTTFSVSLLCETLAAAGTEVRVLTTTANGKAELDAGSSMVNKVRVQYFRRLTKDHSHFSPALLSGLSKQLPQTHVVHIHAWWNMVSILSVLICRMKNARHVLSPRGMFSDYSFTPLRRIFHKSVGRLLLGRAHFHATSRNEETEIRTLFPSAKITVIPNMVELPENIERTVHPELKLVYLSRIDPKKGIELLFSSLSRAPFEYMLDIIGNGEEGYIKGLKEQLRQTGADDNVQWRGTLSGREKFDALASADLFILASYNENFGNAVIEALAAGTPVIISRYVGLADFVKEHDLGWVCDTTAEALAEALAEAVKDKSKRERIQKSAPGLVREHFSPHALADQYLKMYQHV